MEAGRAPSVKEEFKEVTRNSYLPITSCHHKPWLFNIPKGQLIRVQRNCTKESDYKIQADAVGKRFMEKGYDPEFINKQISLVQPLDGRTMIHTQKKLSPLLEAPALILNYNVQYKDIEKIIKKHWYILREDKQLKSILPDKPHIIYKRATTLRDLIVKNVVDPPSTNSFSFFDGKEFFPCKYCFACQHSRKFQSKKTDFLATNTGQTYPIKDFISCHTEGVIYVLQCSCNLQYVGRTKRALKVRVKEHVQNILNKFPKHNVSRHFK